MPNTLEKIAENKYFIGVVMIMMNIGARFMIEELTPKQKEWINTQYFRRFIVFCAFFAATRDLLAATTLTIIFILFVGEFSTDSNDVKNQKKKKITNIDIQNELNSVINKVRMMAEDDNKPEIIIEKHKPVVVKNVDQF
tara:strand:+ start:395 stop:811 length:417 start_codon:yes stop_codon:yes gene_type:complete